MRLHVVVASLIAFAVAAGFAARPNCAYACSCAPLEPDAALAAADAAFVGRLTARMGADAGVDRVALVFSIERAVKGDLGDEVTVLTNTQSAACGLELDAGDRAALYLERSGSAWTSNLCLMTTPDSLLAAGGAPGGRDEREGDGAAVAWVAGAGLLGVLLLAALVLARRRLR